MRKSIDRSSALSTVRLHTVKRQPSAQTQPPSPPVGLADERKRVVERLATVLFAMEPEARRNIMRMAELMAEKHPAALRIYLVRDGLTHVDPSATGGVR